MEEGDADAHGMTVHLTVCFNTSVARQCVCLSSVVSFNQPISVYEPFILEGSGLQDFVAEVVDIVVAEDAVMVIGLAEEAIDASSVQQMVALGWAEAPHVTDDAGLLGGVMLPYPVDEMVSTSHWPAIPYHSRASLAEMGLLSSIAVAFSTPEVHRPEVGVFSLAQKREQRNSRRALC